MSFLAYEYFYEVSLKMDHLSLKNTVDKKITEELQRDKQMDRQMEGRNDSCKLSF